MQPTRQCSANAPCNALGPALLASLVLAAIPVARAQSQQPRPRVEWSAIPALNFDADEGVGYGAIAAVYSYDHETTAYRWTVQPTVFMTTRGRRDYTLFFDAPSRDGQPWRVTTYAGREQRLASPYYGIGNATSYDAALEAGARYFYRYGLDRVRATADVQHQLGSPSLRWLAGAGASLDRPDLTPFDADSTLVARELGGRVPARAHDDYLRAGLTWDTRDREIGTRSGVWTDLLVQRYDRRLGATSSFTRWTAAARGYRSFARLTLAGRVIVQDASGDVPFYDLSEIQTTQRPIDGLGGASTIRGLPKDRYLGKGILVTNAEARWRAADFSVAGRPSSLILSAFTDAGRVWADGIDPRAKPVAIHSGVGGGVRLSYGPSFVISADAGHTAQSAAAVYVGLGDLF